MKATPEEIALIAELGGPTKLAERLGYAKDGGPQRVANWLTRGIPPAVQIKYPAIFLRRKKPVQIQPANATQGG